MNSLILTAMISLVLMVSFSAQAEEHEQIQLSQAIAVASVEQSSAQNEMQNLFNGYAESEWTSLPQVTPDLPNNPDATESSDRNPASAPAYDVSCPSGTI
jgi:hypothetical protein